MKPKFFTFDRSDNEDTSYYMFFDNLRKEGITPYLRVENNVVINSTSNEESDYYLKGNGVRICKKGDKIHESLVKHCLEYLDSILSVVLIELKTL